MPAALVLQFLFSLTLLAVGTTALRVGMRRARPLQKADVLWLLTGTAFVCHGISATLQNVFGAVAIRAGTHSPVMAAYLRWDPVMNHSRTFLLDGLMVLLVAAQFRRRGADRAFWLVAAAVLVAGFAAGALVGMREGSFEQARHYAAVSVWDVAELLLVMATLFVLLLSNAADRFLWAFLSAYAMSLALGVFWLILFTQSRAGMWHPPYWTLHAMRLVCYLAMMAFAVRALLRRRRGETLPGMLGPRSQLIRASPLNTAGNP